MQERRIKGHVTLTITGDSNGLNTMENGKALRGNMIRNQEAERYDFVADDSDLSWLGRQASKPVYTGKYFRLRRRNNGDFRISSTIRPEQVDPRDLGMALTTAYMAELEDVLDRIYFEVIPQAYEN